MRFFCPFGTSKSNAICVISQGFVIASSKQFVMAEASCSKKVAEKGVNVEFSASVDTESDKENTPDVIGNEEYDFLFGSDDIYSDFEGFDEEEILSTDPNFTPTKTGVMIKMQVKLQMFSKKRL